MKKKKEKNPKINSKNLTINHVVFIIHIQYTHHLKNQKKMRINQKGIEEKKNEDELTGKSPH